MFNGVIWPKELKKGGNELTGKNIPEKNIDNKEIKKYWDKVPLTSRKPYSTKLAPSSTLDTENIGNQEAFLSDENVFSNFCVVENYIREVDFLSLISDSHKRLKIIIELLWNIKKFQWNLIFMKRAFAKQNF